MIADTLKGPHTLSVCCLQSDVVQYPMVSLQQLLVIHLITRISSFVAFSEFHAFLTYYIVIYKTGRYYHFCIADGRLRDKRFA